MKEKMEMKEEKKQSYEEPVVTVIPFFGQDIITESDGQSKMRSYEGEMIIFYGNE